jgi:hypothetical protein
MKNQSQRIIRSRQIPTYTNHFFDHGHAIITRSEGCGIQRIYGANCFERMGTISIKESDVALAFRR